VPYNDDPTAYTDAVVAAATEVIQARVDAMAATTKALNRATDAAEANQRARDAAYGIAMDAPDSGVRH
jgi:ABC-type nitrate/sulfonate/bicarbonate transport system substrate-binding protein